MSIQSKEFRGTKPPDYKGTADRALSQLNDWRVETPDARLISIETVESDHGFQCLRVWFEQ